MGRGKVRRALLCLVGERGGLGGSEMMVAADAAGGGGGGGEGDGGGRGGGCLHGVCLHFVNPPSPNTAPPQNDVQVRL